MPAVDLNETLNFALTQEFFSNFTSDFLAPLFANFSNINLGLLDKTNATLRVDADLSAEFNITRAHFSRLSLDGAVPLFYL